MDVVVLGATYVLTLLLGAVLGAWVNHYVKRPKLSVVGSGGGGGPGPGFYQWHVRISNRPGLLGLRISETVIFGKTIHGHIEKGLSIDRSPANRCSARLIDKKTKQHVARLWWRANERPSEVQPTVTIASGETFDLMLFARLHDEPLEYFVYEPEGNSPAPKVPNDDLKFDDTREFIVHVEYSYGRQALKFPVTVQRGFDGRLSVGSGGGGSSF